MVLWAGTAFAQSPGTIPLNYTTVPATDLIYQGKAISASEAFAISGQVDLSSLNPSEDQDLWKNQSPAIETIKTPILPMQEVAYKSFVLSQTGKLRFLAKTASGENLNFVTSKNVHAQLIRRNLLIKLGYQVPEITFVPRLKVNFENSIDRELFVKELSEKTLGDPARWIESSDEKSVIIDDLISTKTGAEIVDLSIGYLPVELIRGRRILNSLQAVYSLTDFSESANLFSWATGFVFNDHLHLPCQSETDFYPSLADIQWMANRMAALTRKDWEGIVVEAHLPIAVQKLITEKLIARRNNLLKLSGIEGKELSYNPKISYADSLMEGELIQERFDGYAARFSFGDPESPMNIKEMLYYGSVKLIGSMIDAAVTSFNALPFMSNQKQVDDAVTERYNRKFLEQVFDYIKTGVYKPQPLGVYTLPSASGNLIASREVIAGNYMGTDNLFQLVDTVGVSGFAGFYLGLDGAADVLKHAQFAASGSAGVFYNRIYSHVKPLMSMKAALKTPMSNILVPLAQIRVGMKLKSIVATDEANLTEEEQAELMEKLVPVFNQKMSPGESFIITDTLGANINVQAQAGFASLLTANLGVAGSQFIVSRLHIFKISDTEYQIYRDVANARQFQAQAKLSAVIPVLKLRYTGDQGKVKMDFYKLKFDRSKFDAEEKAKYSALKEAFIKGTIGKLKLILDPVKFRYQFKQNDTQASLLVAQTAKINSRLSVRVLHPNGEQLDLFKRYTAKSSGWNFMSPASDTFSAIVKILTKNKFGASLGGGYDGGGNAGFTLFGRAKTKTQTFESSKDYLADETYAPVEKVARIWNGWSIRQKGALDILKKIKDRYEYDFYPPDVLNETKKIFLYAFTVNFTFYKGAIENVSKLTREQIDQIAATDSRSNMKFKKIKLHRLKNEIDRMNESTSLVNISDHQNKVFKLIEDIFTLKGIEKLSGGRENFLVYSRIEGFRSKDENGDQAVFSSSYGEYGHFMVNGPFDYLRRLLGVSDAELGINWQLRRIY